MSEAEPVTHSTGTTALAYSTRNPSARARAATGSTAADAARAFAVRSASRAAIANRPRPLA
jgi:hypothetical protein